MSTSLSVSKSTINAFLNEASTHPLIIPEYQRPYSWGEDEVDTLIDDLWDFSVQNESNQSQFYFLGSIVSFINEQGENEIIDGQQRLTTLFLLLRSIYEKLSEGETNQEQSYLLSQIKQVIFKLSPIDGGIIKDQFLLTSRVIQEDERQPLHDLLSGGKAAAIDKADQYSKNYIHIRAALDRKGNESPTHFNVFVRSIIKQTIVLPITADNQDTALIIFQTLNDRGLPLSDSDIFKAKIYNHKSKEKRQEFIQCWKGLDAEATDCQESIQKLFYYYMFFIRASEGDTKSTTPGLRKFYLEARGKRLYGSQILPHLSEMLELWRTVILRQPGDANKWSSVQEIRKVLDILYSYPNEFWKYPVCVYFLKHKDEENFNFNFEVFLKKLCAVLIISYLRSPTVNSIKSPVLKLNQKIFLSSEPEFNDFPEISEVSKDKLIYAGKNAVKMVLKLFAYAEQDELMPSVWEIEHIFPQKWDDHFFDSSYSDEKIREMIEHLGNKTPLEKKLNIAASNGYFYQKRKEYDETKITVTKKITPSNPEKDWTIEDITIRDEKLYSAFVQILGDWLRLEFNNSEKAQELTPEQLAAIELLRKSGFTVNK